MTSKIILKSTAPIVARSSPLRYMHTQAPQAADRLRCVFEEYRQENYSQELPSRFKKEMVQAMLRRSQSGDNRIQLKEIQRVLANIGVSDEQFSSSDLNEVFAGKEAVDVNVLVKYL